VRKEIVDDDWNASFLHALNPMGLGGGFTPLAKWGWPGHPLGSMEVAMPHQFFFSFEKIYI
jgi:hypothetical protein